MAGAVRYATALVLIILILAGAAAAQTNSPRHPTWWAKYQYLLKHASKTAPATTDLNDLRTNWLAIEGGNCSRNFHSGRTSPRRK